MRPLARAGRRTATGLAALALVVPVLGGCATAGGAGPDRTPATADGPTGPVTVFAAASLTDVVDDLVDDVEAAHPGLDVTVSAGGSSALAQQIVSGAPADLFLSASTATMTTVADDGLVDGEPVTFARGVLEIAVPAGNPGGVTDLDDLARADLRIALCAEEVPCGALARTVLDDAGVAVTPVTLEPDVRSALTKVELGEVDAALVYATDVRSAGDRVEGVPVTSTASTAYQAALLRDAPSPEAARVVLAALLGDEGRALLADAGFVVAEPADGS